MRGWFLGWSLQKRMGSLDRVPSGEEVAVRAWQHSEPVWLAGGLSAGLSVLAKCLVALSPKAFLVLEGETLPFLNKAVG